MKVVANHYSRYTGNLPEMAALRGMTVYQLARLRSEATALAAVRPDSWTVNQCCIICGYVDGFRFYGTAFPWTYLVEKLKQMRRGIVNALRKPRRKTFQPQPTS